MFQAVPEGKQADMRKAWNKQWLVGMYYFNLLSSRWNMFS